MGFNENLFAETGYVNSVKFENGTVKHGPEYSIVESLKAKTVDAALIIGSDPLSILPRSIAKNLLEIPVISIDHCETLTSRNCKGLHQYRNQRSRIRRKCHTHGRDKSEL